MANDCTHDQALTISAAGSFDAMTGDLRIPSKWCPSCGALEVRCEQGRRTWCFPKGVAS